MKKFLLTLVAAATMGFAANADEVKFDFAASTYSFPAESGNSNTYLPDGTSFSEGPITITGNKLDGSGFRFWQGTNSTDFRFNNKSGITISINAGKIQKIVAVNSNNKKLELLTPAFTATGEDKTYQWTGDVESLAIVNTVGSTVALTSITVTYTGGAVETRKPADMAFNPTALTVYMGEAFTAPTLTKATNAAVSYTSDKEGVATVDANGNVTLVGPGTAKITATADENSEYLAGTTSYLLTVKDAKPTSAIFFSEMGEDFTFEQTEGSELWFHDAKYGLKASGYKSTGNVVGEAVAVSPVIDLTATTGATLNFKAAYNQFKLNNTMVATSELPNYFGLVARVEGGNWTALDGLTIPEAFSWTFFDNAPVALTAYEGKKMQFGFKYISKEDISGTAELQWFTVNGTQSGLAGIDASAPVEYFNLQGLRVENPENGIFIRRQGSNVTKVIR